PRFTVADCSLALWVARSRFNPPGTGKTIGIGFGRPEAFAPNDPRNWKAQLWEVPSGKRLGTELALGPKVVGRLGYVGELTGGTFSPDGKSVLIQSAYGVGVWEVATGRPLVVQFAPFGPLTFGPDGKSVLTKGEETAWRLWDATSGKPAGPLIEQ